jgi:small subunit ribosomal protein S20
MPNTESAKRSLRKMLARKERNRPARSALRTTIKKLRANAAEGTLTDPLATLRNAEKKIDQAASKGLIHKNKAARNKSRLALLINKTIAAGKVAPAPEAPPTA